MYYCYLARFYFILQLLAGWKFKQLLETFCVYSEKRVIVQDIRYIVWLWFNVFLFYVHEYWFLFRFPTRYLNKGTVYSSFHILWNCSKWHHNNSHIVFYLHTHLSWRFFSTLWLYTSVGCMWHDIFGEDTDYLEMYFCGHLK